MRYVQVPAPVRITNPVTREPANSEVGTELPFSQSCRLAYLTIAKKAPTTALHDLMRKTDRSLEGQWIEFTDEEHKLLAAEMLNPNMEAVNAAWVLCAESHQKAILDAPRELPAAVAKAANGSTAELVPGSLTS